MRADVDNLWPRGVKENAFRLEDWIKGSAPSKSLREWFARKPSKWREFQRRYFGELKRKSESWHRLLNVARHGTLTLCLEREIPSTTMRLH